MRLALALLVLLAVVASARPATAAMIWFTSPTNGTTYHWGTPPPATNVAGKWAYSDTHHKYAFAVWKTPTGSMYQTFLASLAGAITDSYLQKAFGEELVASGATDNPFRFGGQFGYYREMAEPVYVKVGYVSVALGRYLGRGHSTLVVDAYPYAAATAGLPIRQAPAWHWSVGQPSPSGASATVWGKDCPPSVRAFVDQAMRDACARAKDLDDCIECRHTPKRREPTAGCFQFTLCNGAAPTWAVNYRCAASKADMVLCKGRCAITLPGKVILICPDFVDPKRFRTPGCDVVDEMMHKCGLVHKDEAFTCINKVWPPCPEKR